MHRGFTYTPSVSYHLQLFNVFLLAFNERRVIAAGGILQTGNDVIVGVSDPNFTSNRLETLARLFTVQKVIQVFYFALALITAFGRNFGVSEF